MKICVLAALATIIGQVPFECFSSTLAVDLCPQETRMWCWAASGQMIMKCLGNNVAQCDQANREFGCQNCCGSPPKSCIRGGWPQFDAYGFKFQRTKSTSLSWDEITNEIDTKHKPFAFTWHWNGGGGHMMVAVGCDTIDGEKYVLIHDPAPMNVGCKYKRITYDAYVAGQSYAHWDDFYDVH